ncbi:MAG: lipase family protein [Planctomycetia bacterium]|nr:lipase family protein [Planctomycetia bacterium]
MTQQLVEDAGGDLRNAEYLGLASELAYLDAQAGSAAFAERLGLTKASLFSVGNTQAYVCTNDNHIVVAFRGTEAPTSLDGIKDWLLTDAANLLILPEGRLGTDLAAAGVGARFHQGFVNAIADIWEPVYEATSAALKEKNRPLWITGHSLGGALALLAGWLFLRRTVNVHQIYTYGGPMIGNEQAAHSFNKEFDGKIYRYVNTLDPVPQLPTLSLVSNKYVHCEKEMAPPTVGDSALHWFHHFANQTTNGILSGTLISDFWEGVKSRLAAHNLDAYYEMMKKLVRK